MKNYFVNPDRCLLSNGVKVMLLCLTLFLTAAAPVEKQKNLAFNFTVKDLNQNSVELASFKNKSQVVLFFWTTWCPYCRKALKALSQALPDLEKKGITVLPINSGEPAAKVARFVKNNGYTFRIFLDAESAVSEAYQVYGVPSYFVVDKAGYLRSESSVFPDDEIRKLAEEK